MRKIPTRRSPLISYIKLLLVGTAIGAVLGIIGRALEALQPFL